MAKSTDHWADGFDPLAELLSEPETRPPAPATPAVEKNAPGTKPTGPAHKASANCATSAEGVGVRVPVGVYCAPRGRPDKGESWTERSHSWIQSSLRSPGAQFPAGFSKRNGILMIGQSPAEARAAAPTADRRWVIVWLTEMSNEGRLQSVYRVAALRPAEFANLLAPTVTRLTTATEAEVEGTDELTITPEPDLESQRKTLELTLAIVASNSTVLPSPGRTTVHVFDQTVSLGDLAAAAWMFTRGPHPMLRFAILNGPPPRSEQEEFRLAGWNLILAAKPTPPGATPGGELQIVSLSPHTAEVRGIPIDWIRRQPADRFEQLLSGSTEGPTWQHRLNLPLDQICAAELTPAEWRQRLKQLFRSIDRGELFAIARELHDAEQIDRVMDLAMTEQAGSSMPITRLLLTRLGISKMDAGLLSSLG